MELINGADRLPVQERPLFLALGNFDGIHRGHQAIFKAVVEKARQENGVSAALIFNPHPVIALQPEKPFALLTDIVDRAEIMSEIGLNYLVIESFTDELSALTPVQFIRHILIEKIKVSGVFIGANYKFGKHGEGSAETLDYWGRKLNFSVNVSSMQSYRGKEISSSLIRSMLLNGAVREAADYLNYYFYRHGRVIKGYGIGKELVYPTANIAANPRLLWPGKGVYFTAVGNIEDGLLFGVTNVGARPTFAHYDTAVETHILDFDRSIYDQDLRLCFLEKLRDTRVFSSPHQLKIQIGMDIEQGRALASSFKQENIGRGFSLQAGCSVLRSV
jgi:riboflavin kinase / FMN adenylyltransferase